MLLSSDGPSTRLDLILGQPFLSMNFGIHLSNKSSSAIFDSVNTVACKFASNTPSSVATPRSSRLMLSTLRRTSALVVTPRGVLRLGIGFELRSMIPHIATRHITSKTSAVISSGQGDKSTDDPNLVQLRLAPCLRLITKSWVTSKRAVHR